MALNEVFNYFRSYDKTSYAVFSCQGEEPSETDIAAFEKSVGFSLPTEFREFTMSPLGGLYMEVREEIWARPKQFDVGPFWSFLYGVKVLGIAKSVPEWLDIREQYESFREEGFGQLVPFLQRVGDANCYCFTGTAEIIEWSYEEWDEPQSLAMTFSELLMQEIHELEERKNRKIRGEDRRPS